MEKTIQLYSLPYRSGKTYCFAALFIIGNVLLPQICHLLPNGGIIWLPIYFFTLIAAYKYGWKVGLITAIGSPLVNSILFGMPIGPMLPAIVSKSVVLAIIAGYIAHKYRKVTLLLLIIVVLLYQLIGTVIEWGISGSLYVAIQDFRIGIPGILLQIFGGYWFISKI